MLFLLANFTGAVGGVFVLVVLQPQTDLGYLLPAFMLFGLIAANLALSLILQLSKESKK